MVRSQVYQRSNPIPIDSEGSNPPAFCHASGSLSKTKTNSSQIFSKNYKLFTGVYVRYTPIKQVYILDIHQ